MICRCVNQYSRYLFYHFLYLLQCELLGVTLLYHALNVKTMKQHDLSNNNFTIEKPLADIQQGVSCHPVVAPRIPSIGITLDSIANN